MDRVRILPLRNANNKAMLFTPDDTAPASGEYKLYSAAGNCIGSVVVQKGDRLPPALNMLCYYEATES